MPGTAGPFTPVPWAPALLAVCVPPLLGEHSVGRAPAALWRPENVMGLSSHGTNVLAAPG